LANPGPILYDPKNRVVNREVVYMKRPIEPNMGPSLADVLLCMFESANAGFIFISCEKTSVLRVMIAPLQHFLLNETLHQVDSTEK
jgi:hypothetical protein